jgi:hypothetical protein
MQSLHHSSSSSLATTYGLKRTECEHYSDIQRLWSVSSSCILRTLFQLALSPFNWIDQVMGEVDGKLGWMLNKEASRGKTKVS